MAVFIWPTFTASVSAAPAATLWIVAALPPGLSVTLVLSAALSYITAPSTRVFTLFNCATLTASSSLCPRPRR